MRQFIGWLALIGGAVLLFEAHRVAHSVTGAIHYLLFSIPAEQAIYLAVAGGVCMFTGLWVLATELRTGRSSARKKKR